MRLFPWHRRPGSHVPYKSLIELRAASNFALAFYNRGIAYYFQKDFDRAIADYDQAIQFNANNVHAYKNRGLAKRAKGDSAGSDADIAMAKQLNPSAGN